jgi:hypothetical protein
MSPTEPLRLSMVPTLMQRWEEAGVCFWDPDRADALIG